MSVNELRKYKYTKNKTLNHLIDRTPEYIEYVKDMEKVDDNGVKSKSENINKHADYAA